MFDQIAIKMFYFSSESKTDFCTSNKWKKIRHNEKDCILILNVFKILILGCVL